MGRRQQWVYHIEPEEFPPDFPQRLDRFRRAAGLTWRGLARLLKVNARTVWRWKAGAAPGSGHLVALFALAAGMGLLHLLLPEANELGSENTPEAVCHCACIEFGAAVASREKWAAESERLPHRCAPRVDKPGTRDPTDIIDCERNLC